MLAGLHERVSPKRGPGPRLGPDAPRSCSLPSLLAVARSGLCPGPALAGLLAQAFLPRYPRSSWPCGQTLQLRGPSRFPWQRRPVSPAPPKVLPPPCDAAVSVLSFLLGPRGALGGRTHLQTAAARHVPAARAQAGFSGGKGSRSSPHPDPCSHPHPADVQTPQAHAFTTALTAPPGPRALPSASWALVCRLFLWPRAPCVQFH